MEITDKIAVYVLFTVTRQIPANVTIEHTRFQVCEAVSLGFCKTVLFLLHWKQELFYLRQTPA